MKRPIIIVTCLLALTLAVPTTARDRVNTRLDSCNLNSEWSLQVDPATLAFSRDAGLPKHLELSRGVVRVDGRQLALNAADRSRIEAYEREIRALVPEVKAIATEAISIAFTAVDEVARMFVTGDQASHERVAEKLATARIVAMRHVEEAFHRGRWNEAEVERLVGDAVAEMLPVLVGDIVATAVRIALTGDESAAAELEARAKRLERTIEKKVEGRANDLKVRADALCLRLAALDRLEREVSAELAPGERFDLIRIKR